MQWQNHLVTTLCVRTRVQVGKGHLFFVNLSWNGRHWVRWCLPNVLTERMHYPMKVSLRTSTWPSCRSGMEVWWPLILGESGAGRQNWVIHTSVGRPCVEVSFSASNGNRRQLESTTRVVYNRFSSLEAYGYFGLPRSLSLVSSV